MTTAKLITAEVFNGKTYYSTTSAGVRYCAHELAGEWFVSSHRLALGARHVGGGRYYPTLSDVAKTRAFAGLDLLVSA